MKIIINATNMIEDRPLREVERLINSGKGHLPAAMPFNGYILTKEELKIIEEHIPVKPAEITFEDLDNIEIFREPDVIEVDLIEPIPIDHYVDFEEPKISRPKKKVKK